MSDSAPRPSDDSGELTNTRVFVETVAAVIVTSIVLAVWTWTTVWCDPEFRCSSPAPAVRSPRHSSRQRPGSWRPKMR